MNPDDAVTDRLLDDARRKAARESSPAPGRAAMIVGIVALVVSPIAIAGWTVGALAIGIGVIGMRRTAPPQQARLGMILGAAAVLVGLFFHTLAVALG